MSYEELSLTGFINEMKDVSVGPHARKFCFVLGAGASVTSGIKSGQELVNIWDKELLERNRDSHLAWKHELKINDTNKYSFYSRYYERRFKRQPMDGYNYLEKLMEHAKPSIGYVMLSYLLTQKEHNVVITTNFDHLVEDAVNYYTQTIPLIIGHESLAHYISKSIRRPTIIKIHRDLLFDPRNRSDELEELHKNWEEALGNVFSEYHPVFIGYAGNDKSLMNFLLKNKEKFLEDEWKFPYWMLYKTDSANGEVIQFLEAANGYLIRHNGFDEVLYRMGAELDYKLPLEEDFLNDAKKRYQMLSNAVDQFTEKLIRKEDGAQGEEDDNRERGEIEEAVRKVTDRTESKGLYRKAVELYNAGRYAEILPIGRQLTELEPDNSSYHHILGAALCELGQYEDALSAELRALELNSESATYHNTYGVILGKLRRFEESLKEQERAVKLNPDNAMYHYNLGMMLHEMKRYEEALKEKQRAVELDPDRAIYRNNLAGTLLVMKDYEEALKEGKKAVELAPENAKYYWNLGIILKRMGRYEEAQKAVQKSADLEPDNADYWKTLQDLQKQINK